MDLIDFGELAHTSAAAARNTAISALDAALIASETEARAWSSLALSGDEALRGLASRRLRAANMRSAATRAALAAMRGAE